MQNIFLLVLLENWPKVRGKVLAQVKRFSTRLTIFPYLTAIVVQKSNIAKLKWTQIQRNGSFKRVFIVAKDYYVSKLI